MRLVRTRREAERLRGIFWSNGINPVALSGPTARGENIPPCGKSTRRQRKIANMCKKKGNINDHSRHPRRLSALASFSFSSDGGVVSEDGLPAAVPPHNIRNEHFSVPMYTRKKNIDSPDKIQRSSGTNCIRHRSIGGRTPADVKSSVIPRNSKRGAVHNNHCLRDRILSGGSVDRGDISGNVLVEDLSSRRQNGCRSQWDDDVDNLVSKSSRKGLVCAGDDFT
ncbi:unnamed protein product, partial [Sphacelaria rigidula]